jgi:hypothetical protein
LWHGEIIENTPTPLQAQNSNVGLNGKYSPLRQHYFFPHYGKMLTNRLSRFKRASTVKSFEITERDRGSRCSFHEGEYAGALWVIEVGHLRLHFCFYLQEVN